MCNRQPCASASQFSFAVEQCSNSSAEPSTTSITTTAAAAAAAAVAAAAAAAGTRSALRYHAWAPTMVRGDWRCQYHCETVGRSLRVSRGAAFVDGTRCEHPKESALGLCVSGRCQTKAARARCRARRILAHPSPAPVLCSLTATCANGLPRPHGGGCGGGGGGGDEFGCDGVLSSGVVVDACGTCGGDGSSCFRVNGTFHGGEAKKYVTFLRVPLNATSVHVSNTRSAYTHLALLVGRVPVVAGRGSVSTNVSAPSALEDERLTYRLYLTELKIPRTERLSIPGPVTQPTHVQVYRRYGREYGRAADPDIVFSFHLPHGQPLYQWEERRAPCPHTCGTGTTRAAHVCVDPSLGSEVPSERCLLGGPRPLERTVPCSRSLEPCPAPPHE
ncbi:A disintegrin and metalloproteinase with thrombospondin motifs 13-like [Lampetra planeri]